MKSPQSESRMKQRVSNCLSHMHFSAQSGKSEANRDAICDKSCILTLFGLVHETSNCQTRF